MLEGNWTGTSTVPSRGLYPHQWSWDSAFIAIGLRHLWPLRAQTELETLLDAQWADGRIPHIVFNASVPLDAYFPSPDFWRSSTAGRAAGAPRTVETSGIVQPPVHALAAWLVHRADPGLSRERGFLPRVYPRLAAWHRYLLHRRDLGGGGLVSVVHPWEQGMDNSPVWDAPLSRITPAPARSFRRADLDHGAPEGRPTDLDYGRYVRLATDYRDSGYADETDEGAARRASVEGGDGRRAGEFAVEDPAFNALLIVSEYALARIARELGATGTARHARAQRLTTALIDRLWDPAEGMFFCRDLRGEVGESDALEVKRRSRGGACVGSPRSEDGARDGERHPRSGAHDAERRSRVSAVETERRSRSGAHGGEHRSESTAHDDEQCSRSGARSGTEPHAQSGALGSEQRSRSSAHEKEHRTQDSTPSLEQHPRNSAHKTEHRSHDSTPSPEQHPQNSAHKTEHRSRSGAPSSDPCPPVGVLLAERSVSGLIPLLLPALPRDIVAALVRTLTGPRFGLGGVTRLVPSYDLLGEAFDPHRYWRGPAWFNTGWLLERGLRTHREHAAADALREALLETADTSDFAEYVDPYTGEARGARGFGWTAALTLDLLHTPHTHS
ncbi:MGH1-like glycoside hydrolase domain-containing protein [Streptomyces sp. NPDC002519]